MYISHSIAAEAFYFAADISFLHPPLAPVKEAKGFGKTLHYLEQTSYRAKWIKEERGHSRYGRVALRYITALFITTVIAPIGVSIHALFLTYHLALNIFYRFRYRKNSAYAESHKKEITTHLYAGWNDLQIAFQSRYFYYLNPLAMHFAWNPKKACVQFFLHKEKIHRTAHLLLKRYYGMVVDCKNMRVQENAGSFWGTHEISTLHSTNLQTRIHFSEKCMSLLAKCVNTVGRDAYPLTEKGMKKDFTDFLDPLVDDIRIGKWEFKNGSETSTSLQNRLKLKGSAPKACKELMNSFSLLLIEKLEQGVVSQKSVRRVQRSAKNVRRLYYNAKRGTNFFQKLNEITNCFGRTLYFACKSPLLFW